MYFIVSLISKEAFNVCENLDLTGKKVFKNTYQHLDCNRIYKSYFFLSFHLNSINTLGKSNCFTTKLVGSLWSRMLFYKVLGILIPNIVLGAINEGIKTIVS